MLIARPLCRNASRKLISPIRSRSTRSKCSTSSRHARFASSIHRHDSQADSGTTNRLRKRVHWSIPGESRCLPCRLLPGSISPSGQANDVGTGKLLFAENTIVAAVYSYVNKTVAVVSRLLTDRTQLAEYPGGNG